MVPIEIEWVASSFPPKNVCTQYELNAPKISKFLTNVLDVGFHNSRLGYTEKLSFRIFVTNMNLKH